MQRFTLSGWTVKDNIIEIRLRFFTVYIVGVEKYTLLRVVDNYGEELITRFKTLEEAVAFTERIILHSHTREEIKKSYQEMYGIEDEDCEVVVLNDDEIKEAIESYFTEEKGRPVMAIKDTKMLGKELCVNYHLDGLEEDLIVTNVGLKKAFSHYLKPKKLEVVSFKEIQNEVDGTPHFIGYKVFVKPKTKKLAKEFKENKEQ